MGAGGDAEIERRVRTIIKGDGRFLDTDLQLEVAARAEQGRRAVMHALSLPVGRFGEVVPTGIYTIPELACVGATEEGASENLDSVVVGRASFAELARAQITHRGDGFLKLVACSSTRRLLGVHIAGEGATELIHIAQAVLNLKGTVDYFVENTFNYPTLAEAYKIAGLDAFNRMPIPEEFKVRARAE